MFRDTFFFIVFLFTTINATAQQNWQAVGPDDNKQPTFRKAGSSFQIYSDNNSNYLIYNDASNSQFKHFLIKKETADGWQAIGEFQNYNTPHAEDIDSSGNVYCAYDTLISSVTHIKVRKFSNGVWTNVGSPFMITGTLQPNLLPPLNLKVSPSGTPYIQYYNIGYSDSVLVIKWDGSNWGNLGNIVGYTTGYNANFIVASNDTPIVVYGNNNSLVFTKKYDGTNWVLLTDTLNSSDLQNIILYKGKPVTFSFYYQGGVVKELNNNHWDTLALFNRPDQYMLTKMAIDSSGNIYFIGAYPIGGNCKRYLYLNKVSGSQLNTILTITDDGYNETMKINAQQQLNICYLSTNFDFKLIVKKLAGNNLIEPFPPTIHPFSPYYDACSSHIYPLVNCLFINNNSPAIAEGFGGLIAYYQNGNWNAESTTVQNTNLINNVSLPVKIMEDTSHSLFMFLPNDGSSFGNYTFGLYQKSNLIWTKVGSNLGIGANTDGSFVIGKDNIPYVTYVDNSVFGTGKIIVRYYNGSTWLNVNGNFYASIDSARYPLIACDTSNNLSILYKDHKNLVVKKYDGNNWNAVGSTIDTTSFSDFQYTISDSGDPVVAYLQFFNGVRKPVIKKYNGTNWVTIGTSGFSVGAASLLNLTTIGDSIYLAYHDNYYGKVVVAKYDGTNFGALGQTVTPDSSSSPYLARLGNDMYLGYYSSGYFVKKLVASLLTPFAICGQPTPITLSNLTDTSAHINWSTNSTSTSYQYGLNTTNAIPSIINNTNGTSYSTVGLLPNTTYYFYIRSICMSDTSSWFVLPFTTYLTNILSTPNNNADINVFPNPVSSTLNIEQKGSLKKRTFLLYDMFGRVIQTQTFTNAVQTINMKDLSSGVYSLIIQDARSTLVYKIIKQ